MSAPDAPCQHPDWVMIETGYVRQWHIDIDEDTKTITAYWGGSEDFSESGAGDECLQCTMCLATKPLPEGFEVDYE